MVRLLSFYSVTLEDIRTIASIPSFTRTAIDVDSEHDFGLLSLYV